MGLFAKKSGEGDFRLVVHAKRGVLGKEATRILKRPGITVERARSLKAVFNKAGSKTPPSMILLQASRLDDPALDACGEIRRLETEEQAAVPVVVIYPPQLVGLRDAALAAGAYDVLPEQPPVELFERVVLHTVGVETRKHPRVSVSFQVKVFEGNQPRTAYAENLSLGGIQIRSDREVGIGTPVRLELLWSGDKLSVWAVGTGAIRVRKAVVTGMRFVGLSPVELARLESYLAARGGVTVNDPYEALAGPARLEVADVIRLASGVDAAGTQSMKQSAMRFTNAERLALTGMGGDAADAEPLIAIAVARLKASQFVEQLERFDLSAKEAREYAHRIAKTITHEFQQAVHTFHAYGTQRMPSAPEKLRADLRSINHSNKRLSFRLSNALEQVSPDLAQQMAGYAD